MNTPKRALAAWLPALACMALIWTLSSMPQVPDLDRFPHQDKVAHLIAYGVLALLYMHALRRTRPAAATRTLVWIAAALATAYGASDELHQSFVPGRDASPGDLLADAVGGTLGAHAYALLARSRPAS